MTWATWIKGAISAVSGGISAATSVYIVTPANFDYFANWDKITICIVLASVISLSNYISRSPMPTDEAK